MIPDASAPLSGQNHKVIFERIEYAINTTKSG